MSTTSPPDKPSLGRRALRSSLAIVGALFSIFAVSVLGGATLVWLAALIGITWLILRKCNVEPVAAPMLAILIGQTGWSIVGHVYLYLMGRLPVELLFNLFDVVFVVGLLVWFLIRRSRAAAIGVLVYQFMALASTLAFSGEISIPDISSQALAAGQWLHVLVRTAGIAFAIYAIVKLGKKKAPASTVGV